MKNGLKRISEYIEASNVSDEKKDFEKTRAKVQREIENNQTDLHKGVIIFASESLNLWSVHYVQVPIQTSFHLEKTPILDEFIKMNEMYPNAGIILPSLHEVRIIDTSMGVFMRNYTLNLIQTAMNGNVKKVSLMVQSVLLVPHMWMPLKKE